MSLLSRLSPGTDERSARLTGIGLMLLGIGIFSFGDALGKFMVATYSVGQLLLLRSGAALVLLSPFIWRQRGDFLNVPRPGLQALRGALSALEVAAFFLAVTYLPLADVITVYLATPIFVTAVSAVFLGEKVGWRRWTAVAVGFAGVVIAVKPSTSAASWPSLIALGGTLAFSGLMIVTRSLRGTPDIVLGTAQVVGTLALGVALSVTHWVPLQLADIGLYAVAGVLTIGAMFSMNRSLKLAPASVVVPYQYTMIIWAMLLGFLFFGDVPGSQTVIGAAIIAAAGIYIFMREQALGRASPPLEPPA